MHGRDNYEIMKYLQMVLETEQSKTAVPLLLSILVDVINRYPRFLRRGTKLMKQFGGGHFIMLKYLSEVLSWISYHDHHYCSYCYNFQAMAFCLGTLVELLDQILHPHQYHQDWVLDDENKSQIESLFVKASSLRDSLANSTPAIQARLETLEDVIRDVAENAEDKLESYIKAQVLSHHRRSMQSLFEMASFLRRFVAGSAPLQANFQMLKDVIRKAAGNVEDIIESCTNAQYINPDNIPQIQALCEKSSFLRNFLANPVPVIQDILVDLPWLLTLEGIIRDAAEDAQQLVLSNSSGQSFMIFPPDVSDIIQVFDSVAAEIIKITDVDGQTENTLPAAVSRRKGDLTSKDVVVGVDKCLRELNDQLTSRSRALEIIPIVGMGGIGKTTVARKLYHQYSSNKRHFDICAWATVSQAYDSRQVILSLLGCIKGDLKDNILEQKTEELIVTLYQELFQRRYLIVLDDIWSSEVWDVVQVSFPDDNNNSRIILTTRENVVANHVRSKRHEMHLLSKDDSWELFEKIVHGGEKCPNELEKVGRTITNNCGGLPLAIQVIGGFLSRVERISDLWEAVANDTSSFIAKEDDQFSGIFSWSYANLPHYLKPCLLYIGSFPEDHAIQASGLIKLWVAEGFLHPIKDKSPEEVAEIYLEALIDRNLIFVHERTFSRRVKSYGIHDLLRDLCMKKAEEKTFIFSKTLGVLEDALFLRRVCASSSEHIGDFSGFMELTPEARSFKVIGKRVTGVHGERTFLNPNGFQFSLLWVLDLLTIKFHKFPEEILELVNLKYLSLCCESDPHSLLPLSLVVLKNLQTIIFQFWGVLEQNFPMSIFHLSQLRHIKMRILFPGPLNVVPYFPVKETLQSLSYVSVAVVTQLLGKLPCLKSLGIDNCKGQDISIDLTGFPILETIKVKRCYHLNPIFPQTLRKLTMRQVWDLSGTFMSIIGSLPNLQLLRLDHCLFESEAWEPCEGGFSNLQYLWLENLNLKNWLADETHFPQLKHLVVDLCRNLKGIPLDFGDIDTLEIIRVDECKPSVFHSARSILQEQLDLGNETLQLSLGTQKISDDDDEDDDKDHKEYDGDEGDNTDNKDDVEYDGDGDGNMGSI